jgi:hypothetical protein
LREADPQRDHEADIEFVNSDAVSKKVCPEMTPAIGEKRIELVRRYRVGVELFVDERDITV